jgi:hypothetical protein
MVERPMTAQRERKGKHASLKPAHKKERQKKKTPNQISTHLSAKPAQKRRAGMVGSTLLYETRDAKRAIWRLLVGLAQQRQQEWQQAGRQTKTGARAYTRPRKRRQSPSCEGARGLGLPNRTLFYFQSTQPNTSTTASRNHSLMPN